MQVYWGDKNSLPLKLLYMLMHYKTGEYRIFTARLLFPSQNSLSYAYRFWPNYNIAVTRCHVNFYSFKNTSPHHVLQQSSRCIDICHINFQQVEENVSGTKKIEKLRLGSLKRKSKWPLMAAML